MLYIHNNSHHVVIIIIIININYIYYINPFAGALLEVEVAKNGHFDFRHFSYDILYTACYSHYINLYGKHNYILVSAKKIGR